MKVDKCPPCIFGALNISEPGRISSLLSKFDIQWFKQKKMDDTLTRIRLFNFCPACGRDLQPEREQLEEGL